MGRKSDREFPVSTKRGVTDYLEHQYAESATPRIVDSGKSIFYDRYLGEFEIKIAKATPSVY
jgi:hypothetical protein